jgi:hypothetical protein
LLEDDAGLFEPRVDQGRPDGPDARGRHARVGVDERQHPCAMIERTSDHGGQVVLWRDLSQAPTHVGQHAWPDELITAMATGQFQR